jgi:hypothetical protein
MVGLGVKPLITYYLFLSSDLHKELINNHNAAINVTLQHTVLNEQFQLHSIEIAFIGLQLFRRGGVLMNGKSFTAVLQSYVMKSVILKSNVL